MRKRRKNRRGQGVYRKTKSPVDVVTEAELGRNKTENAGRRRHEKLPTNVKKIRRRVSRELRDDPAGTH